MDRRKYSAYYEDLPADAKHRYRKKLDLLPGTVDDP